MNLVVGRISIALQHKIGVFEKGTYKVVISPGIIRWHLPLLWCFFNHVHLVFFLHIVLLICLVQLLASGEQHNLQTV